MTATCLATSSSCCNAAGPHRADATNATQLPRRLTDIDGAGGFSICEAS